MMEDEGKEIIVVAVCYNGEIRWYRSDRDLWVLDVNKWRNEFISYGYSIPELNEKYRFGIHVVNNETVSKFLDHMSEFEISKDELSFELANRFTTAKSWWDVKDLFPMIFVDFEHKKVGAFYAEGTPMERYVPDGWVGEFIDFANEYPESIFPIEDKFWVKGNTDLLKTLNDRGASNK